MGKVNITIGIEDGKGQFGCNIHEANISDLALANAKLDIMKKKLTDQIEKAMQTQANIGFEQK